MFSFNRPVKFYIYNKPTDMRKSFDGLSGIIINFLQRDPLSGSAYLFINRSRNRLKILLWDHGGYWILYKRLEQGTFQFADDILSHEVIELGYDQLQKLVYGVDINDGSRRKRYTYS